MARSQSPPSLAANLLLAVSSVLITLLLFAALEGVLRLLELGAEDASRASRLRYQQVYPPMLEPGRRSDGTAMWATADIRLPYQTVLAEKPENALRVFSFGGSATAGLGYSPNVTFSRHLQRLLERAYPERSVEVVNLGIVALSSSQVRVLVEDVCRHYEPDVVVVYSGNNEFLEIHAEKFARAETGFAGRLAAPLLRSHLFRVANRALRGPPKQPSLPEQDFSKEDLRLSQHSIIQRIEMEPGEVEAIVDRYADNIDRIARVAADAGARVVLMTVASNWRYRGREDLPADWLDEVLGEPGPRDAERLRRAIETLKKTLKKMEGVEEDPMQRWEALYRRAVAEEALGELPAARESYRAAMNRDPHLRRALDAMADRVRDVALRRGVHLFDTIQWLAGEAKDGIVGFDDFYDYVHFTPSGALRVGAQLFREFGRAGITNVDVGGVAAAYVNERLGRLAALDEDDLERHEWMGIGFGSTSAVDRDLWKYERMLKDLDRRIETDQTDLRALVYRGNARAFRPDAAEGAAADYREALALDPYHAEIRANLESLLAQGRVR